MATASSGSKRGAEVAERAHVVGDRPRHCLHDVVPRRVELAGAVVVRVAVVHDALPAGSGDGKGTSVGTKP